MNETIDLFPRHKYLTAHARIKFSINGQKLFLNPFSLLTLTRIEVRNNLTNCGSEIIFGCWLNHTMVLWPPKVW